VIIEKDTIMLNQSEYIAPVPADKFRKAPMGVIWIVVLLAVVMLTKVTGILDAVLSLIQNQGLSDEDKVLLGFIAYVTFPLTSGVVITGFLYLKGKHQGRSTPNILGWVSAIFVACWILSLVLGIGKVPVDLIENIQRTPGNMYVRLPVALLKTYATYYGLPLFISSVLIGFAFAMQIERWFKKT
jgi:hypothetical protein